MKYLLDTNVLLWFTGDSDMLPSKVRNILLNPNNELYISTISLFEITIKSSIGKLKLGMSLPEYLDKIENSNIKILSLENDYYKKLNELPYYDNHRDPFDRIIIATGIVEDFILLTADSKFDQYPVNCLWKS
ncbi:MAG: type II toxin-antitoxin system VapC family toxin [Oscillospiraceae bacterium]|nr:type II toxin-antitoxin system VapC family toxin [Oscillospiraceae bacterium]